MNWALREHPAAITRQQRGEPRESDATLQLKTKLAGMDYEAQMTALRPPMPILTTSAGSHSSAPVQQKVTKTNRLVASYSVLVTKKLGELVAHADKQVDWHRQVPVKAERARIQVLLEMARKPYVLGGGAEFRASDVWTNLRLGLDKVNPNKVKQLQAYGRGLAHKSAKCQVETSITNALKSGEGIVKLEASTFMSNAQLSRIFEPIWFDTLLVTANGIQDFVQYVDAVEPNLHAEGGAEIETFIGLLRDGGSKPHTWASKPLKNYVLNFHRFERKALVKLNGNIQKPKAEKTLTVILHTALDHSGAFFRDQDLTKMIRKAGMFVVMIEGLSSLSAYTTKMDELIKKYGKRDSTGKRKMEQVMIAGHGDARVIELAGQVDPAHKDPDEDNIDLDLTASKRFLKGVIDRLVKRTSGPKPVLVFNACLTASNEVDLTKARAEFPTVTNAAHLIKKYIKRYPSLVTFVDNYAASKGYRVKSVGSNSSTVAGGAYLTPGKRLTLNQPLDPEFANPNKLVYIERGKEADGVLRSILEMWAQNKSATLAKVRTRYLLGATSDWQETIIRTLCKIIYNTYPNNAAGIASLVTISNYLPHFHLRDDCKPEAIVKAGLMPTGTAGTHAVALFQKLKATSLWSSRWWVRLVFYQIWGHHDASKHAKFLLELNARSCAEAKPHVDVSRLNLNAIIPYSQKNTTNKAKLKVALIGMLKDTGPNSHCKEFLKRRLGTRTTFLSGDGIGTLLGGASSERDILAHLVVATRPTKRANLDVDGKPKNEVHVEPMNKDVKATANGRFHKKPDLKAALESFGRGEVLHVIGKFDAHWFAVAAGRHVRFVQKVHTGL